MRAHWYRTVSIGFLILVIGSAGVQPGFGKGARGHVYSKSAGRPSSSRAKPAPQHENNPQGSVKTDIAHPPVTRGPDKPADIDARITVQPRQLGKSINPSVKPLSVTRNPYQPRTLSALPRVPNSQARNAIGIPILPRGNIGAGNGLHPKSLSAPASAGSPAIPHSSTGRIGGIGGVLERVPRSSLNVASPAASRGVISGTGVAPRHLGPPQIGRPNAVAGINGTTIRPHR
jgi:hypothetical protein